MSTLTLGIIVIIYMFVIAWLGYLGYRQTKNASDWDTSQLFPGHWLHSSSWLERRRRYLRWPVPSLPN